MIRYSEECIAAARGSWLIREPDSSAGGPRATRPNSIRVFENPFLELISRAHPVTPGVWFGPVILVAWAISPSRIGAAATLGLFTAGMLIFSLFEYGLHRFVFHGVIRLACRDPRYRFTAFMVHGYHHAFPNDRWRLVMPPMISWPLAVAFALVYVTALGEARALPLLAGTMAGYVTYDWMHYFAHHARPKSRLGKWLRRYHLRHHFQDEDAFFGISSPLWDAVFGTFRSKQREAAGGG